MLSEVRHPNTSDEQLPCLWISSVKQDHSSLLPSCDALRCKTDRTSTSRSSCVVLFLLWSGWGSVSPISSAAEIWATSNGNPWENDNPCSLLPALSKKHWPQLETGAAVAYWLGWKADQAPSELQDWTTGGASVYQESQQELCHWFQHKDFASLPGRTANWIALEDASMQGLKSHTRVNTAECLVSVTVTKIISVFLPFCHLSGRIKPPGIINSQRLLV